MAGIRFLSIVAIALLALIEPALAQEAAPAGAPAPGTPIFPAWAVLSGGFGIGIAAFGGALGQGRTTSAALEGISRNPGASGQIFLPMILGLVLIESLVIYAFVIAFFLVGTHAGH